jgi:O-antigen/teichoic acid export membrane protein
VNLIANTPAWNRSFARSVVVLASGTAGGQAIAILASPFLSRLYTPDEFGTFGVYLALVSIAAVAVSLRYEAAIPLPDGEDEAIDVLVLTFLVTIGMTVLTGLILWLAVENVAVPPEFRRLLWLMPIGLGLTGLQQILTFWAIRRQVFGASAQSSIAQGATQAASQLALGVVGAGSAGMALGYVLARVSGIGRLAFTIGAADWRLMRRVSVGRLRAAAVRYRRFPLFALWSSLLSIISQQAPILILAAMFDATVVGWFSITVRVLQLPSAIVGNAVGQVFYARVSRSDLSDITLTTTMLYRSLVTLGAGPMWLLAFGGEAAFSLVFGDAWREAGRYAQWLAPWLLLDFVTTPLSPLAYVRDRQLAVVVFQGLLLGARVGALVLGAAIGGSAVAIALYGLSSALLMAAYLVWLLWIGGVGTQRPLRWFIRELIVGVILAAPLLAATIVNVPALGWVGVATACLALMVLRGLRAIRKLTHPGEKLGSASSGSSPG